MATHTTQTMLKEEQTRNSSKYQAMYDNLMNEDRPFQGLQERIEQLKKEKTQEQTK